MLIVATTVTITCDVVIEEVDSREVAIFGLNLLVVDDMIVGCMLRLLDVDGCSIGDGNCADGRERKQADTSENRGALQVR